MSYYSDTTDIPEVPGPAYDRLLAVKLQQPIYFLGTVVDQLNTQQKGYDGYVIRVRSVLGQVLVCVTYKDMVRITPWSNVYHAIPHPEFRFDQGPVMFEKDWQDDPSRPPWEFPRALHTDLGDALDPNGRHLDKKKAKLNKP